MDITSNKDDSDPQQTLKDLYAENKRLNSKVIQLDAEIMDLSRKISEMKQEHKLEMENKWKPLLEMSQQANANSNSLIIQLKAKVTALKKALGELEEKYQAVVVERDLLMIEKMNLKERFTPAFQRPLDSSIPRRTRKLSPSSGKRC